MENSFKKFIYLISFVAVFFIGIVLLLGLIFGNKITSFLSVLNNIALVFAYFVVCVNAFFFVRTKRSAVYTVLYLLAVVLITVCFIIPFLI